MKEQIKGYVIFNITKNKYIFNGLCDGRKYFIYGDLGSARRKMTALKDSKKYDSLQQRIDKAIEYIENNTLYSEEYDYDDEDNLQFQGAYDYKASEDLLNILKGSDK